MSEPKFSYDLFVVSIRIPVEQQMRSGGLIVPEKTMLCLRRTTRGLTQVQVEKNLKDPNKINADITMPAAPIPDVMLMLPEPILEQLLQHKSGEVMFPEAGRAFPQIDVDKAHLVLEKMQMVDAVRILILERELYKKSQLIQALRDDG